MGRDGGSGLLLGSLHLLTIYGLSWDVVCVCVTTGIMSVC